jgi:hypothetical protein
MSRDDVDSLTFPCNHATNHKVNFILKLFNRLNDLAMVNGKAFDTHSRNPGVFEYVQVHRSFNLSPGLLPCAVEAENQHPALWAQNVQERKGLL